MSTKPRGYRSAELPSDPALLLRTLRACRDAMIRASAEVKMGCALSRAGCELTRAIDVTAIVLTGDDRYFAEKGHMNDQERAHWEKWAAIEKGDLPWPR